MRVSAWLLSSVLIFISPLLTRPLWCVTHGLLYQVCATKSIAALSLHVRAWLTALRTFARTGICFAYELCRVLRFSHLHCVPVSCRICSSHRSRPLSRRPVWLTVVCTLIRHVSACLPQSPSPQYLAFQLQSQTQHHATIKQSPNLNNYITRPPPHTHPHAIPIDHRAFRDILLPTDRSTPTSIHTIIAAEAITRYDEEHQKPLGLSSLAEESSFYGGV